MTPGRALQLWLMSSYLYYERYVNVLTDPEFDKLSRYLLNNWDTFDHPHKYLVTEDDLRAGTGFAIREYPLMVQGAASAWYRKYESRLKEK